MKIRFRLPSIPLLYVPDLEGETAFALTPEAILSPHDARRLAQDNLVHEGAPTASQAAAHHGIPENIPGLQIMEGWLTLSHEIRLCIVPDGHGGFAPALETRPRILAGFPEGSPFSGRHHVTRADSTPLPASLADTGTCLRPAGRSLGLVIGTPLLKAQMPFDAQVATVDEGLQAAQRIIHWWNHHADELTPHRTPTMTPTEKTIARIPEMSRLQRKALRANAERLAANGSGEARAVLDALDSAEAQTGRAARPTSDGLQSTGLLQWEPRARGTTSTHAFHEGRKVGRIFKHGNHSNADKEVYTVEILGTPLPRRFQHIAEARTAGEAAFAERQR